MTYIDGFVLPVPTDKKDAYVSCAREGYPYFREHGCIRHVEAWSDDVPHGTRTDYYRSVQAKEDESIVFSWLTYADRAARDAANQKIMTDERMANMDMPFDMQRMIVSGFEVISEVGDGQGNYIDGMLAPVANDKREEYRAMAQELGHAFIGFGAVRVVDAWGDDVSDGKQTDFKRAVDLQEGETTVFGWVEWPDKAARDAGWQAFMADESAKGRQMPFDGKRMVYGGFSTVFDQPA